MGRGFKTLFYEDGEPIDPRCVKRFVRSFPRSYQESVQVIIKHSERMDNKVFPTIQIKSNPVRYWTDLLGHGRARINQRYFYFLFLKNLRASRTRSEI